MPEPSPATWSERSFDRTAVVRATFEVARVSPVRELLQAAPRPSIQFEPPPEHVRRELYLDTKERHIHRAGCLLAVHELGAGSEVSLEPLRLGAAPRWVPAGSPVALSAPHPRVPEDLPGPLRPTVEALIGPHRLRVTLDLETLWEDYVFKEGDRWIGTVTLLDSAARRPKRFHGVRLGRVEIRTPVDTHGRFHPLFEELRARGGLRSTVASRYEAARLAVDAPTPRVRVPGVSAVQTGQNTTTAAFAILRRLFVRMLEHEPGARLGHDPRELHRMRVAARQFRTTLRIHRAQLPRAVRRLDRDYAWIARKLGVTRDLDVQRDDLARWCADRPAAERRALQPLRQRLEADREAARRRTLRALDSKRFRRLRRKTERLLRREPSARGRAGAKPIAKTAPKLVRRSHRRLFRGAESVRADSPSPVLHALRSRVKELRSGIAFHRELWGRPADRYLRRVKELQDLLGTHQDAEVSLDRLHRLLQSSRELPSETEAAVEVWMLSLETRKAQMRTAFAGTLAELRGPQWKRLKQHMHSLPS